MKDFPQPNPDDSLSINSRIRLARIGHDVYMPVKDVAERAGLRPPTIYSAENGHDAVSASLLTRIEKGLCIQEGSLLLDACSITGDPADNIPAKNYEQLVPTPQGRRSRRTGEATIFSQINARIKNGIYTGTLPTYAQFAQEFNTTRSSVNKVLKPLRDAGIIETGGRGGTKIIDGTFLKEKDVSENAQIVRYSNGNDTFSAIRGASEKMQSDPPLQGIVFGYMRLVFATARRTQIAVGEVTVETPIDWGEDDVDLESLSKLHISVMADVNKQWEFETALWDAVYAYKKTLDPSQLDLSEKIEFFV